MTDEEKIAAWDALAADALAAGIDTDDLVDDASLYVACEALVVTNQPEAAVELMGGNRFLRW